MFNKIFSLESIILAISIMVGVLAYSITTTIHQGFLNNLRYFFIAILTLLLMLKIFHLSRNLRIPNILIVSVIVFVFLISYGMLSSAVNGGFKYFYESWQSFYYLAFSVLCLMSIIFFSEEDEINSLYILFFFYIFSTVSIFVFDGLVLSFPPHFVFSYSDNLYSQGMSKFYMIGALVTISLAVKLNGRYVLVLLFFTILYLFLSFLGGARGDFIIGLLVLLLYGLMNHKRYTLLLLTAFTIFSFFISLEEITDSFIMLERLARVAGGDFGTRDVLFLNALEILTEKPSCLIVGCGFNFFQAYFGYDFGFYPHNSLMEYVITYGFIVTFFIFSLSLYGFFCYLKSRVVFIPLIAAYVFILSMKSGSIFEFLNLAFIIYFLSYGILTVYSKYSRKELL